MVMPAMLCSGCQDVLKLDNRRCLNPRQNVGINDGIERGRRELDMSGISVDPEWKWFDEYTRHK